MELAPWVLESRDIHLVHDFELIHIYFLGRLVCPWQTVWPTWFISSGETLFVVIVVGQAQARECLFEKLFLIYPGESAPAQDIDAYLEQDEESAEVKHHSFIFLLNL
jgi:hypothetical protein